MKHKCCFMICTHGRAYNQITLRTLYRLGITEHIYLIVDDEDEQRNEYEKEYEEQVIVFDKEDEERKTDTLDNNGTRSVVLFARNVALRKARDLGYKKVVVCDDDILEFSFRYVSKNKLKHKILNDSKIFNIVFEYMDEANIDIVSFGNDLDYIGGLNGLYNQGIVRKANNIFLINTEKDIKFCSRFNEDTNTCYMLNKKGRLVFDIPLIQAKTKAVGKGTQNGGMKEAYKVMSDYLKAFYSVVCMPDTSMIFVDKKGNINLKKKNAYPMIISEVYKKK